MYFCLTAAFKVVPLAFSRCHTFHFWSKESRNQQCGLRIYIGAGAGRAFTCFNKCKSGTGPVGISDPITEKRGAQRLVSHPSTHSCEEMKLSLPPHQGAPRPGQRRNPLHSHQHTTHTSVKHLPPGIVITRMELSAAPSKM